MSDPQFEEVQNQIETLRKQLHKISKEQLLTDPKVIEISQQLDELLNEYQQMLQKELNRDK